MTEASRGCTTFMIVGAGGHGREVASYVRSLERSEGGVSLLGFVDDRAEGIVAGVPVISTIDELGRVLESLPAATYTYITAVGNNAVRRSVVDRLTSLGIEKLQAGTLCHPSVTMGEGVEIDEGTCVAPGAILTTDLHIGRHCIVNVSASVSHDSIIGDYCNLNPGVRICGAVRIGADCFIGAGATVINGVSIGEGSIIGAGAVVVRDIPPHVTAVGVPARVIKHHG